MKKAFCILTAILLLLAAMIPVSAIEEVEPQAYCSHEYELLSTVTTGQYFDEQTHKQKTVHTYVCSKCGDSYQQIQIGKVNYAHDGRCFAANCDGWTQTQQMKCTVCQSVYIRKVTCPLAPHYGNPCLALPA